MAGDITDTVRRHTDRLMALPNVVSVGVGEMGSTPAILVGVTGEQPSGEAIPETLEGHPVVVQTIGRPTIQPLEEGGDG